MQEGYYGGSGIRKFSKQELKKMKENMRKTPIIQEKSEKYHRLEQEHADKILLDIENSISHENNINHNNKEKVTRYTKLKKYLFG